MDQPYSVIADWLSKFHTWPEFIQGMWLVAVPVTVLGVTWIVMRGLRDLAAAWRGRGEATLYGIPRDWPGPPLTYRGGRLRIAEGETPPPLPAPSAPPPSFRGGPQDRARPEGPREAGNP
ncbi:hypothetical protein [Microvirga lenta]|uniref:hypothetical protein n=1 Tax=Microvirga lenta TaxID=2881337 RepID=UPI001CFFC5A0|nr:hypothetical protein [Microvirga lenta]MCB5175914.1 hypothetical protein [Microvirga lenta]